MAAKSATVTTQHTILIHTTRLRNDLLCVDGTLNITNLLSYY